MAHEYQCECCKGVFETDGSIEEAMAESRELFGEMPDDELSVICDDCFSLFMQWFRNQKGH